MMEKNDIKNKIIILKAIYEERLKTIIEFSKIYGQRNEYNIRKEMLKEFILRLTILLQEEEENEK